MSGRRRNPHLNVPPPNARRRLIALLIGLIVARTSFAWADNSARAEALIRDALDLRRAGDDSKARHLLREALELSHSPRSAGQLGFCEQALGSWLDAEGHLEEALRKPEDAWIKKNRQTIQEALVLIKTHIARIEVNGDPPGAKVLINGISVGQLPMEDATAVAAGEIEIELRAPGFATARRTLHVQGGQYQKVSLSAEKETRTSPSTIVASSAGAPAATTATAAATATGGSQTSPTAVPSVVAPTSETGNSTSNTMGSQPQPGVESPSASGTFRKRLKFVSWGLAAAALGLGAYGVVHNDTLVKTFDSGCTLDTRDVPRVKSMAPAGFSEARCADLKSSYEAATTLGVAGLVAGGILAAGGVVLWLTETGGTDAQTAHWSCVPSALRRTGPAVTCLISF